MVRVESNECMCPFHLYLIQIDDLFARIGGIHSVDVSQCLYDQNVRYFYRRFLFYRILSLHPKLSDTFYTEDDFQSVFPLLEMKFDEYGWLSFA